MTRNQQCRRRWRGVGLMVGLLLSVTGCAELDPMIEPETADLQLMVHSLQAAARESERTLTEVRAELEGRRQELSAAVVAKAQLEGRLREIERRLTEARHIIELQREELLVSRAERERALLSRVPLQSKLKPSRKSSALASDATLPAPIPASPPVVPQASVPGPIPTAPADGMGATPSLQQVPPSDADQRPALPRSAALPLPGMDADRQEGEASATVGELLRNVAVKAGDTLYSLARRYGVDLGDLRAANGLQNDRILVGQALVLPPTRDRRNR